MSDWTEKDLKHIWHPYTQMKECVDFSPVLIEKAKGIKLYDAGGNFYYDTISSWWCNVHGHNHPKIKAAIKDQLNCLEHVLFAGFTHKPAIQLAQTLVSITPSNLTKVFFSDNGSTSVEVALKMSFQYWQNKDIKTKKKFISLDSSYHGDTIGAMSVSGVDLFNSVFSPLFFPTYKVPAPYCYRCPMGKKEVSCGIVCVDALEELVKKEKENIAALIIEPLVCASGGMIVYPKQYLQKAADIVRRHNIHLILDEVATGFGRTGKMFAYEYAGVKPDFMCLSKGITSGYLPLGVTLTTNQVYQEFFAEYKDKKTFYHGHTFTANPLACSAAIASLAIFEEEDVLERISKIIPIFHKRIKEFLAFEVVGDVRCLGLIGAIELVKDRKRRQPFSFEERISLEIYKEGLKENLILRPLGNIIYFFLPLCINEPDLRVILDKAVKVFKSVFSE